MRQGAGADRRGRLEAALNSALGIQSPSTRMVPTGSNVAAGVGEGMDEYGFTGETSSLAGRLSSAVSAAMPASLLRPAGLNAMRGLTAGINAGRSGVISAMRSAVKKAKIAHVRRASGLRDQKLVKQQHFVPRKADHFASSSKAGLNFLRMRAAMTSIFSSSVMSK